MIPALTESSFPLFPSPPAEDSQGEGCREKLFGNVSLALGQASVPAIDEE